MHKLRIGTGISGGGSLTGPLRDARRFPSTRWYSVPGAARTTLGFGRCAAFKEHSLSRRAKPLSLSYDSQLLHRCIPLCACFETALCRAERRQESSEEEEQERVRKVAWFHTLRPPLRKLSTDKSQPSALAAAEGVSRSGVGEETVSWGEQSYHAVLRKYRQPTPRSTAGPAAEAGRVRTHAQHLLSIAPTARVCALGLTSSPRRTVPSPPLPLSWVCHTTLARGTRDETPVEAPGRRRAAQQVKKNDVSNDTNASESESLSSKEGPEPPPSGGGGEGGGTGLFSTSLNMVQQFLP
jgi:hypothetical protein